MEKHKSKNEVHDLFEECVCANECTGLYQKVSLDKREIAKFHKLFIEEKEE